MVRKIGEFEKSRVKIEFLTKEGHGTTFCSSYRKF